MFSLFKDVICTTEIVLFIETHENLVCPLLVSQVFSGCLFSEMRLGFLAKSEVLVGSGLCQGLPFQRDFYCVL